MTVAGIIPNVSLGITVLRLMKQVQKPNHGRALAFCSVVFANAAVTGQR